ncbi:MAG: ribosome small subunit-dependent GTPase A [Gemmatales bacterium]|nr:ribosome small subunit-dependent GTPase A [Gemmatales bacterium]
MGGDNKRKIRIELRKNRQNPTRERDLTRYYGGEEDAEQDTYVRQERVSGKGNLTRHRTVTVEADKPAEDLPALPAVDVSHCLPGRILRVQGLYSTVLTEDGRIFRCVVRKLLRDLSIDERNVVVVGDRVWIRPATANEGSIERVEPRHGLLTRGAKGKEHIIAANVDQVVIVASLAEPVLKPHLVDRYLVSAEKGQLRPIVCFNKADLVDLVNYQWLIGMYSQLGIPVIPTSARTGMGIDRLKDLLRGRETVFAGQSGVGKSSLLNAIQPGLQLKVRDVSEATQKGRHTTTTAELIHLDFGAWVVDTPGIRQFALWEIPLEELDGYFPELRPFVALCQFPGCSHTHEHGCAVKEAVRLRQIPMQRYETYLGLRRGETFE